MGKKIIEREQRGRKEEGQREEMKGRGRVRKYRKAVRKSEGCGGRRVEGGERGRRKE